SHVELGAALAPGGRLELPDAKVRLARERQLERGHAQVVEPGAATEDLYALRVERLDDRLAGGRPQRRVEPEQPDLDRLAGLVDWLVGLQEEQVALLDPD